MACPATDLTLETFFSYSNCYAIENPFIIFILGIFVPLLIPITFKIISYILHLKDSISGVWLLCILDEKGRPIKYDRYILFTSNKKVSGYIDRVHSLESKEQIKRRYYLKGFADDTNFVYSFWPISSSTASFGACSLNQTKDNYYEGIYTRPYNYSPKINKPTHADIRFTRSKSEVENLVRKLGYDEQNKIIKKVLNPSRIKVFFAYIKILVLA